MIKNIFIFILIPVLFFQCGNPTKNNSTVIDNLNQKDSCCKKDGAEINKVISETSEITCPKCGHKKIEELPTDVCVIKYICENCKTVLTPKMGDCCVYCTYGTHKCPSKQEE